jgi:hypothetical protein
LPEKIIVSDLLGKSLIVLTTPFEYELEIDILSLKAGIYFVNVYFDSVIQSYKVVKQ